MKETLLKAGTLIVGNGQIMNDISILIKGESIIEVGYDIPKTPDTAILDYSDRVIMPGIIECHVHTDMVDFVDPVEWTMSDEHRAIRGAKNAEVLLQYGVTTFADACSRGDISFGVRDAIEAGHLLAPRMLVSGRMITITGGRAPIFDATEADGPDEARKAARKEIMRGVDFIKVAANSLSLPGGAVQFTMEELKAVTEEAHKVGLRVHSHAYHDEGVRNTIMAGVDVVVHGHLLTQHNIDLIKGHNAFLEPTLVSFYRHQGMDKKDLPESVIKRQEELYPQVEEGFRKAVKQGCEIVLGSDTGDSPLLPFGPSTMKELEFMVQLGGMSEMDAIVAGTENAARAFNIDSNVGTIEPGKSADLLVFAKDKDPLRDISILQHLGSVERIILKGETVVKR